MVRKYLTSVALTTCLCSSASLALAAENGGSAYPDGTESFFGGAMPPPGMYLVNTVDELRPNLCAQLLFRQRLEKLLKDAFPMPICGPYDGVGIMVDDDCNVFMPFAIARFINADIH